MSDGNWFKGNWAIDNDEWGFWLDAVRANMFRDNECSGNGLGGSNQPGVCDSAEAEPTSFINSWDDGVFGQNSDGDRW